MLDGLRYAVETGFLFTWLAEKEKIPLINIETWVPQPGFGPIGKITIVTM
jgi:hypothetical protein